MEEQIVIAYENENLTPQQIAEQFELDEVTVKLVLSKRSSKFRKALRNNDEEISPEESKEMLDVVKSIARSQLYDNPGVALKAAIFVYNESKGRNNKLPDKAASQVNIFMFNEELKKARERLEEMRQAALESKPIIDISKPIIDVQPA